MAYQNHSTYEEITTQPSAWTDAVESIEILRDELRLLWQDGCEQVLFTGCGSTYYLSLAASSSMQSLTGRLCSAHPASEFLLSPDAVFTKNNQGTLLIAISRSGSTTETVKAVEKFKGARNGHVVVLTNYGDSVLASHADLCIAVPAGQEKSVVQTRSFSSLYVASCALASIASNNPALFDALYALEPVGNTLIEKYNELAYSLGKAHEIKNYFYLGSGSRYGLASEASLKLKEMSLANSEPFHFLEFRHGPISMVDANSLVVGLLGEKGRELESAVIADVRKFGGKTLTLAEQHADISFHSGVPEAVRGVLYLPVLQLLAYYRASSLGRNPDEPRNLTAVVELDL